MHQPVKLYHHGAAGLVFYDPGRREPVQAQQSLGLLFFLQLVWALLPFMVRFGTLRSLWHQLCPGVRQISCSEQQATMHRLSDILPAAILSAW